MDKPESTSDAAESQEPKTTDDKSVPTQEELRKRYLEQQRRMRCEGCGESEEYF